jgi:ribosomal protein L37AE/L43A
MAGIFWTYLIPIIVLVLLGALLVSALLHRSANDRKPDHCSSCETPMSLRRIPAFRSHVLLGRWMCPHCGTRMDKSGRNVSGTA